jgi:hypothetical protein
MGCTRWRWWRSGGRWRSCCGGRGKWLVDASRGAQGALAPAALVEKRPMRNSPTRGLM